MKKAENHHTRAVFGSKFAAVATTVGSAVGLGNIWRFPYETGVHGGSAFILCYLGFALMIGVPVLIAEFILGRSTRSNILGAYRKLTPDKKWYRAGYLGIVASLLIMGFYAVVAGWTLEYFIESITGNLDFSTEEAGHNQFISLTTGWHTVLWTVLFSLCNFAILMRGVTKGIERLSNILMPVLFAILIIFCVRSLFLPGFKQGMEFLFTPDISKITPSTLLGALGQAFFSLSLGVGTMITYSSYFSERTNLQQTAVTTMLLDSAVAVLSGVIIFPAVFSYGISPTAGPTLVFEVLPNIFHNMAGGVFWSTLFFFLLFLASLTSTISMCEISISFLSEEKRLGRKKATAIACGIALTLSMGCALSMGPWRDFTIGGMTLFNLFDYVASNVLMPIGGMIGSIFVGWLIDRRYIREQLTNHSTHSFRWLRPLTFILRWICPAAIFLVLLDSTGLIPH
ncbi:MAG: sodium-dependent transporter [Muribaculaceae bacterium]|nr:sodium-dependent transporter [Muribaculaceae bacterium]